MLKEIPPVAEALPRHHPGIVPLRPLLEPHQRRVHLLIRGWPALQPRDQHIGAVFHHQPHGIRFDTAIDAGADWVSVHAEACVHLHRAIQTIHKAGAKAGVALNPATSVDLLRDVVGDLDFVLIMSVNPGFGGQRYIEACTAKIRQLRDLAEARGQPLEIEVDGGVNAETVALAEGSTGGLMSAALLAVPGASAYFLGARWPPPCARRHEADGQPDQRSHRRR